MKTAEEILNFFGVEIGKKYIVTKDCNAIKAGEKFEIETKLDEFLQINLDGYTTSIYTLFFLNYKEVEEILDKKEKEYLRAVIKPFRDKVKAIQKIEINTSAYIKILMRNFDCFSLPIFKSSTMYKGMKANENYTIEELGL